MPREPPLRRGPALHHRAASDTDVTRQATTKHLKVVEDAGLVRGIRRGRERIWELDGKRLEIARGFLEQVSRRWDDALGRPRRLVEKRA